MTIMKDRLNSWIWRGQYHCRDVSSKQVDLAYDSILEYTSWWHSVFLATNSFSWLNQVSFVVLDILCLLVHNLLIEFALKSSSCLKYRFFLLYILLYCLSMFDCFLFPILSRLLVLSYYSFIFLPAVWFLLLFSFSWTLLSLLLY